MIRLIAALDRKRGIAKQGFQPWSIPADLQHFAELTKSQGAEVLMGSTTFKVMGGALPDRQNYVLTHDKAPIEGVSVVNNLDAFLKSYRGSERDLWIIGGANVYAQAIEARAADELYITHIEAEFGCNQFFPEYSDAFMLRQQSDLHEQHGFLFSYAIYAKN